MEIIIAGAGDRGRKMARILPKYGLAAKAFIDGDSALWNKKIEGLRCYPKDYFQKNAENYVIIVSPQRGEGLFKELSNIYSRILPLKISDMILKSPYNVGYKDFFEIGHYYSLYPNAGDVLDTPDWANIDRLHEVLEIDFSETVQEIYLDKMIGLYHKVPQWEYIDSGIESKYRYRLGNPSISAGDAVGLFCMLNIIKPKRLIEVGSGYSSAMSLDVNQNFLGGGMELTFIEPFPELLNSLLIKTDNINLIKKGLEDVELYEFGRLEKGDILFIDSTHVSKAGSDVNYLFFEILPRLKPGVFIHLHDIFYPFTYPHEWTKQGMVWNELYLLRSFLMYNKKFEIIFFQNMMEKKFREKITANWPIAGETIHGGSFWMRKKCE